MKFDSSGNLQTVGAAAIPAAGTAAAPAAAGTAAAGTAGTAAAIPAAAPAAAGTAAAGTAAAGTAAAPAAAGTAGKTKRRFKRSGSGKGKFIGGYKKPEGFKDFKTFYKDAKETLGADKAKEMLATSRSKSGEDYSWGQNHQKTWDKMQKQKATEKAEDAASDQRDDVADKALNKALNVDADKIGTTIDALHDTSLFDKNVPAEASRASALDDYKAAANPEKLDVSDQDLSTGSKAIGLGSTGGLKLNETFARWKKIINHNK
jgi:hypothetical protein